MLFINVIVQKIQMYKYKTCDSLRKITFIAFILIYLLLKVKDFKIRELGIRDISENILYFLAYEIHFIYNMNDIWYSNFS